MLVQPDDLMTSAQDQTYFSGLWAVVTLPWLAGTSADRLSLGGCLPRGRTCQSPGCRSGDGMACLGRCSEAFHSHLFLSRGEY